MDKFEKDIDELKNFLVDKARFEYELEKLREMVVGNKEGIQWIFINLFNEVYSQLESTITNQIQFAKHVEKDEYYGDLSAEYKIANFNISITFNSEETELMEVKIEIENEVDEIDDEISYELTMINERWTWLKDRQVLTKELLLCDIKDVMMG